MGSNGSKKASSSRNAEGDAESPTSAVVSPNSVIVLSRKGSMYIDEDGDIAHEFYIEVPPPKKGCKATMKRILHNLIPQGEVAYKFPRLHVDFPIILHHI